MRDYQITIVIVPECQIHAFPIVLAVVLSTQFLLFKIQCSCHLSLLQDGTPQNNPRTTWTTQEQAKNRRNNPRTSQEQLKNKRNKRRISQKKPYSGILYVCRFLVGVLLKSSPHTVTVLFHLIFSCCKLRHQCPIGKLEFVFKQFWVLLEVKILMRMVSCT